MFNPLWLFVEKFDGLMPSFNVLKPPVGSRGNIHTVEFSATAIMVDRAPVYGSADKVAILTVTTPNFFGPGAPQVGDTGLTVENWLATLRWQINIKTQWITPQNFTSGELYDWATMPIAQMYYAGGGPAQYNVQVRGPVGSAASYADFMVSFSE